MYKMGLIITPNLAKTRVETDRTTEGCTPNSSRIALIA